MKLLKQSFFIFVTWICTQGVAMGHNYPGALFVVEGMDGAGKTTLIEKLEKALQEKYPVVRTKERGGSGLGSFLRPMIKEKKVTMDPDSEFLVFAGDRTEHFKTVIIPKLQQGNIIISDRMNDSSEVYQGHIKGVDLNKIKEINQWAMQGITPDLVLYLKIDASTALTRIASQREIPDPFEKELNMQKVQEAYDTVFENRDNVIVIDAIQDQQTIVEQAVAAIEHYLQHKQKHD